jgi:hypothetical protein
MTVICMDCKKKIREKFPIGEGPVSHGICDECLEKRLADLRSVVMVAQGYPPKP